MVDVLVALETFVDEHSRCGTLRSEHDGAHAWLACSCGVRIDHALAPPPSGHAAGRERSSTARRHRTKILES